MNDDKRIAIGGSIKAAGDAGLIDGYLVYFTDENEKDLHHQFFDAQTDYVNPPTKIVGGSVLYQHGLDDTIGVKDIGSFTAAKVDTVGIWVQAQLDLHDEYQREIFGLAKKGILSWSSGALPQSVEVEDNGHIKRWKIIEGSLTPTPAMPLRTVISAKAYTELLKDGTGHEGQDVKQAGTQSSTAAPLTKNAAIKDTKTMNEILQRVIDMLMEIINGEAPMTEEEVPVVTAALEEEVAKMSDEEKKALEDESDTPPPAKSAAVQKLFLEAEKARATVASKKRASYAEAYHAAKAAAQKSPQRSIADQHGVPTKSTRISVAEERQYADMSASDMMLALKMRQAALRGLPYDPKFIFGAKTEGFMRTLAHKTAAYVSSPTLKSEHANAMKAVMPWKANELDASTIVGQGYEWVGEGWDTDMWMRERAEPTFYDELVRKGMRVRTIPQGQDRINIPTEGADPRWFTSPQATSLDVTRKPETTANFTPIGTGNVELTAPEITCATSVTYVLEEDSIINVASEVNRQIQASFLEMRDQLILNGDIVRTASANINYIDGTPPSGLDSPYYLAFDGLRKMALVTYTAQARFGGALTYADFLATINLLPYAVRSRMRNIVMVVSPDVEAWALNLPEVLTSDVRRDNPTAETGRLPLIYGQLPITSDYIPQTGVAGKEYQLTANLGNNIYGTIVVAYAPYLAFGNKRNVTVESERNMYAGTVDWVARVRMGMVARGADGVGLTYGLSES